MSLHAIIVSIITILCGLIQVEFQSKTSSVFETHPRTMFTFLVVLLAYALSLAIIVLANDTGAVSLMNKRHQKYSLCFSGALAAILLLLIINPLLGQVSLAFWALCLLKVTVYQLVKVPVFELFDKLSGMFGTSEEQNPSIPQAL